ncbi:pectin lyase fold/virulence factor [Rhodocollybia butyracea]|uniref:Pectin lyase fold/virulence factor n=1 Tax=Rhodocollybia butyracea TaxID=206335 RepID=A0A9P5U2Q1_9AGAR|nr:pectin lyase fold/virulence factor [Rhodocollybia butyracea]
MFMFNSLLQFAALSILVRHTVAHDAHKNVCVVAAEPNGTDSAPAIIDAFRRCGHNPSHNRGKVVFTNDTYDIKTVMNTTGLSNVDIDFRGTLLWDTNIKYWLNHSLPVGYQNQSTAWLFGGDNVRWNGHGYGTLDGNGQVWYEFINGTNNYPGRPHQITITGASDSVFEGIRFVQSQMWTMSIIHADNLLFEGIYINSTVAGQEAASGGLSINTDGADTIYANNITFRNWTVDNGDDSISLKANSTNILIENCDFYTGLGVAIGSIGQYDGVFETIENVTARNILINNMIYGVYIKTWTGVSTGFPPNGGGGGLGFAANLTFSNFTLNNATGVFAITQCTSYNGATGGCDTSLFNLRNLTLENWSGSAATDVIASMQCSGASPCTGITIGGIEIVNPVNDTSPANYLCDSVLDPIGFNCTGTPWGENNRR